MLTEQQKQLIIEPIKHALESGVIRKFESFHIAEDLYKKCLAPLDAKDKR